jgi:hypothetical protein
LKANGNNLGNLAPAKALDDQFDQQDEPTEFAIPRK